MKLHEVVDSRPLIWRIVAQQIEKGKKVIYSALRPNSWHYLVGRIDSVNADSFTVWMPGERTTATYRFTDEEDDRLVIRPSNNPEVADFMIVEAP